MQGHPLLIWNAPRHQDLILQYDNGSNLSRCKDVDRHWERGQASRRGLTGLGGSEDLAQFGAGATIVRWVGAGAAANITCVPMMFRVATR